MRKRIMAGLIALALMCGLTLGVSAIGFDDDGGGYSESKTGFAFIPYDALLVYNGEIYDDPEYRQIWAGSSLYVPIGIWPVGGDQTQATAADIKEFNVQVGYRAVQGRQYIKSVTIVDSAKAKVTDLPAGAYARVEFTNDYTGINGTTINLDMVLSVNKASYPETTTNFKGRLVNWLEDITESTVYTVHQPTAFRSYRFNDRVTFDFGNQVRYFAQLEWNENYYLSMDRQSDPDIAAMYPKIYMEYYNFVGDKDTFGTVGNLELPINRAKFKNKSSGKTQVFVYEILPDDTLKALDESQLSFNSKTDILTIRTETLGSYLLSGQPLLQEIVVENDNIIYTGYAQPQVEQTDTSEPTTQTAAQQTAAAGGTSGTSAAGRPNPNPTDNVQTGGRPRTKPQEEPAQASIFAGSARPASSPAVRSEIRARNKAGSNPEMSDPFTAERAAAVAMAAAALLVACGFGRKTKKQ